MKTRERMYAVQGASLCKMDNVRDARLHSHVTSPGHDIKLPVIDAWQRPVIEGITLFCQGEDGTKSRLIKTKRQKFYKCPQKNHPANNMNPETGALRSVGQIDRVCLFLFASLWGMLPSWLRVRRKHRPVYAMDAHRWSLLFQIGSTLRYPGMDISLETWLDNCPKHYSIINMSSEVLDFWCNYCQINHPNVWQPPLAESTLPFLEYRI